MIMTEPYTTVSRCNFGGKFFFIIANSSSFKTTYCDELPIAAHLQKSTGQVGFRLKSRYFRLPKNKMDHT